MCYKTRRKGDVEEMALAEMRVVKSYPFIILLVYKGACGNYFKTSMTWAEAVILNRMPQEELTAEVVKMQQERGLPYYISREGEERPGDGYSAEGSPDSQDEGSGEILCGDRESGWPAQHIRQGDIPEGDRG